MKSIFLSVFICFIAIVGVKASILNEATNQLYLNNELEAMTEQATLSALSLQYIDKIMNVWKQAIQKLKNTKTIGEIKEIEARVDDELEDLEDMYIKECKEISHFFFVNKDHEIAKKFNREKNNFEREIKYAEIRVGAK